MMKFSKDHEWATLDGTTAKFGITDFAQHALGYIVFVETPEVGATLAAGDIFGTVESVKAVSDMYAPLSGKIVAVNTALEDAPELLNESPYDSWIIEVECSDAGEFDSLMEKDVYDDFCDKEA